MKGYTDDYADGYKQGRRDAKAEHTNPELSIDLLRSELDACRTLIGEQRRELAADERIIRALWPDVDERWSCNGTSDTISRMVHDGVLADEDGDRLRAIVGWP